MGLVSKGFICVQGVTGVVERTQHSPFTKFFSNILCYIPTMIDDGDLIFKRALALCRQFGSKIEVRQDNGMFLSMTYAGPCLKVQVGRDRNPGSVKVGAAVRC